jgi:hypothetical protein
VVDLTPRNLFQAGESMLTPKVAKTLQELGRLLFNAYFESEEVSALSGRFVTITCIDRLGNLYRGRGVLQSGRYSVELLARSEGRYTLEPPTYSTCLIL